MEYKVKKQIVDKLINEMDSTPEKFNFSQHELGYKIVPTLKECNPCLVLNKLDKDYFDIILYFGMMFVSSCWQIKIKGVASSFDVGFILGFRLNNAIKKLNKYKLSRINNEIEIKLVGLK